MPHIKRFVDEDPGKELIIPDDVVPGQKDWEDGKKYVIELTVRQIGRDTMFERGATRYKVLKSVGSSRDAKLADKVRNRT